MMARIKALSDITTTKVLMAAAALASLTAIVSNYGLCVIWFNQPKMPESVRQMKFKG
jgi:cyclic lactone autoinducer peptide